MCIRFVYRGNDIITGFNFDIDLSVWKHKVIKEKDRFFIGIKMPDGMYHSFHGINKNGNVGTLLYVHGNPEGIYNDDKNSISIPELTEKFIKNEVTFDEALSIVKEKKVVYAPDTTMQAVLSDRNGRTLMIEPGIGYSYEKIKYSLMSNDSVLNPKSTEPFIIPGDDRYQRAKKILDSFDQSFSTSDALSVLYALKQEEPWATRWYTNTNNTKKVK